MNRSDGGPWRAVRHAVLGHRSQVAQRILASVLGGYVLTMQLSQGLATALSLPRFDAVMAAALLSFLLYLGIILWVFAVHSLRTMWLGLLLPVALLSGIGFPAWGWTA